MSPEELIRQMIEAPTRIERTQARDALTELARRGLLSNHLRHVKGRLQQVGLDAPLDERRTAAAGGKKWWRNCPTYEDRMHEARKNRRG